MTTPDTPRCPFEHITEQENQQIDEITDLTVKLLDKRYTDQGKPILRGVHPKSHGCVKATFTISHHIDESYRVRTFDTHQERIGSLFIVKNSKWVSWIHEESYGMYVDNKIIHYTISIFQLTNESEQSF